MMTTETKPWDAAEVLNTPADIAAYLDAYLEDGTPEELLRAVNTIIRMGRGAQMGVDHNKGFAWVGASAGFIDQSL